MFGSSRTTDWSTDPVVFERLDMRYGPLTLDVCASAENAKCERFFTVEDDELRAKVGRPSGMNPPYGRTLGAWMAKAHQAALTTAELVVCLVPARTDTRWWHEHAADGDVEFIREG